MCYPHAIWAFLREKLVPLLDKGSVEVFNFHGEDLDTRYICSLPGARAACENSRKSLNLERARTTNTDLVHGDRIAKEAWVQGIFEKKKERKGQRRYAGETIVDYVRNNLNMSFTELPTECLSDDVLSESLFYSVRVGKEMLGDELDVDALKSKFFHSKSQGKFCSVNVTAVLADPEWRNFLETMSWPTDE